MLNSRSMILPVVTRLRLAVLLIFLHAFAAEAALIHQWHFNETSGTNLSDFVGTAHGSIMVIGTGPDYTLSSGAFRMSGGSRSQTDYAQFPSGLVRNLTNVTIEVWATPRAGQTWSRIFDFGPGNGTAANDFYLSFCRGSTSLNQQRMEFDPAPLFRVDTGLATTVSNQYHYVVSWSATAGANGGGLAQWYRDGLLIGSTNTGNYTVSNVNDTVLWLGRSQFTGDSSASADYNEFRIYNHAMGSNEVNFSRTNGPDLYIAPPAAASSLIINTNPNVLALSWTPGPGSAGSVVVMRVGQATSIQPNYGNTYTGNAIFGSGANLGSSNFVVYAGAGNNVTVTNLIPGVRYYAAVYSYTGNGASRVYNLADAPTTNQLMPGVVQSISLQVNSLLAIGGSAQANVLATYVGGAVVDVTSGAAYVSSATNVITVSSNGALQALAFGSAWITASFQGKFSSNSVSVIDPVLSNLKHRYNFTVDAADLVGTAHGTLEGGATIATNHVVFNGATAFVNLPNNLVTGFTSITLETWVTDNGSGVWGRVFDLGNNDAGEDLQGAGTQYLFLALPGGPGNLRGAISLNGNGGEQLLEWEGNRPAVGQKSHIVWTSDDASNVGRLYVNGVQVGVNSNMTVTPAAMGPTVNNWLGKSVWPDPYFNGAIDEFRIYDIALPASVVLSNYQNGPDALVVPPPVTVADAATLNPGAKVLIDVLANDIGATINPATVQVINPPANGSAVVKPDGKILYTHNGSATTSDAFTYRVQNYSGSNSPVATVSLTISSALRLAAPTLALPPAAPPVNYQFVDAFPGLVFEDALAIHTPPGRTNQIFVVERRGRISYVPDINAVTPQRLVFLDLVNQMSFDDTAEGERGLMGMAFHPGFATNGYFFVFYTAPGGSPYFDRLARFTANPTTLTVDTNTQLRLFDVADQVFNHNGGDLHFGPDGYLYIGTGDEGDQYNQRLNAQRIDRDLFSALLRIDVDKRPGSVEPKPSANTTTIYTNGSGQAYYSIPPSNPFVNATSFLGSAINTNTLRAEIFATGFRHIWRFSIDAPTGDIWVGDVGQDWIEEINIVTNGGNYGWAYHEGLSNAIALYPSQTTLLSDPPPSYVHAPPFYSYLHTGRAGGDPQLKGNSVTGGVVYRGTRIPELTGAYIFGDFESTHVWALWRTNNSVSAVQRLAGVIAPAGFGLDPGNGDVLIANYVMNRIERLVAVPGDDDDFPQKLSDTGAFADLTTLAPNPGIVSYEPIESFWSDHAVKRRWFGIPNLTDTVTHVADGNWTLPTGMVWVKHFDMEMTRGNPATKQRLETRFIVKTTNSIYGVSYAWNAAGTEAFLVPDGGTNFNLTITNGGTPLVQQWSIPSRSECLACHTTVGGHALSFNTRQLNQTAPMNGFTGNQLALLSAAGYFANPVTAPQTLSSFAKANDSSVSLEHRVRSYLSVNCVQCHQPAGSGPSTWDARAWLSLDETTLLNGTPYNNGGNPANKLIIPGDTAHSVVLQRIRANGFSRMPPLATTVIDDAATNLLHTWISTELTNRQSFAQWQLAIFGSTNLANALASADSDGDGANNYYEYLTQTSPTNSLPAPWTIAIDEAAGTVSVSFQRIANLGFLVETSTDFSNWSAWNVPDNVLWFSAANFADIVTGPLIGETNRYFRVKIIEP